jgi:hypothetical protein
MRSVIDLDELDKEDFKEMCSQSSNKMLVNLCEYELKAARGSVLDEVRDMHYEMAEIAYEEMERRSMV